MGRGSPSKVCRYCRRSYTKAQYAEKVRAKAQNALNSRAKAEANGNRVVRKRKITTTQARIMRLHGQSVEAIAGIYSVSTSAVYRRLQEKP